ncbi:MAG: CYTH domain-containing protein [Flavobacteriales bacterium]|nr:CYTH domain-containing protein [Flavobacteriales bacterium]
MEIERKYLVCGDFMTFVHNSTRIVQGYICDDTDRTVRVRIRGEKGYITIKGRSSADGLSRYEWEKEIPMSEAESLLSLCKSGVIDKTRHLVSFEGHTFEVDVFAGKNVGLVMAEVELSTEDEKVILPQWIGKEVTGDTHYYNSYISSHPYSTWK